MPHRVASLSFLALCLHTATATAAEPPGATADLILVEAGQPKAEIVIAAEPQRSVRLAAHELQTYVQKISGAHLPIVTEPSPKVRTQIYIGRSPHTDRLKITAEGLSAGAYRTIATDRYLVLIGDDTDFTPIEPFARNNGDIANGKLQREWDAITGALWGNPTVQTYKHRTRLPATIGKPDGVAAAPKETFDIWGFDERGSYNAVCGLLYDLGVRWYLPGELGEVVPQSAKIAVPRGDRTTRPDMAMRRFHIKLATHGPETGRWSMRLGMRDPFDIQVAHGLEDMTHRDEIFARYPEWFALYGGKRQNQPGQRLNQLCYSNQELFEQTVRNVRLQFDHYHYTAVSVMPPDGYTAICQCPLCAGKDSPERDERGRLSDYVWDFVNRVALEVYKTHPDRKVLGCAYGVYTLPPQKMEKLAPNVVVSIVGGQRPMNNKPEQQAECRQLREAWAAKTSNPLIIFENYPFTDRGWYLPAYTPHSLGETINASKGLVQGEDISLSVRQDFDKVAVGFNHFMVYFSARMYWGGKSQDVDALFREYCRLFYGPAEHEMHAFFIYCEANWQEMEKDQTKADQALALFALAKEKTQAAAKSKIEPSTLYGRRVALVDDYLNGLRNKVRQLAQKRGRVPTLRLVGETRTPIVVDGKLDEAAWTDCPVAATARLRELETGRVPTFATTVKAAWRGRDLYFAVRCDERPGEKPNSAAARKDDQAVWYGDAVEILLETEMHTYYQIVVNPAGALVDLDRGAARHAWFSWDSQAQVATQVADDHWTAEIRIPVTEDENDPLHQVIGHKPTRSLPWHINVCRQRLRDSGTEYSALSPTGTNGFHELLKFAHFYDGNSYEFEADPNVTDFITEFQAAHGLVLKRRGDEALAKLLALADDPKATPLQKSAALERAALQVRSKNDYARAAEFTRRIPIPEIQKTAQMLNLLAEQKPAEVIRQFAAEDIAAWPFWQSAEGWFARGRAYAVLREGPAAEKDLSRAAELIREPNARRAAWLALGTNREQTLKDETGALAAYRQVIGNVEQTGTAQPRNTAKQISGADEFSAVQGLCRILAKQGKFEEARAALQLAHLDQLRGVWRGAMLLTAGEVEQSAGNKEAARAAYQSVINDPTTEPRHKQQATAKLNAP